jgi:hypothetical protein
MDDERIANETYKKCAFLDKLNDEEKEHLWLLFQQVALKGAVEASEDQVNDLKSERKNLLKKG